MNCSANAVWVQAIATVALCLITFVYAWSSKATERIIRRNSEEQRRRQQIMVEVLDAASVWGIGATVKQMADSIAPPRTQEEIKWVLPELLGTGAVYAVGYQEGRLLYRIRIHAEGTA